MASAIRAVSREAMQHVC